MKKSLYLIAATLATFSLTASQRPVENQQPTNEEMIAFLDNTKDLCDKASVVEINFVISKGETSHESWQAFVAKTAAYIKTCLADDEKAIQEFVPFVQATCATLAADEKLHGSIAIDLTDGQDLTDEE